MRRRGIGGTSRGASEFASLLADVEPAAQILRHRHFSREAGSMTGARHFNFSVRMEMSISRPYFVWRRTIAIKRISIHVVLLYFGNSAYDHIDRR